MLTRALLCFLLVASAAVAHRRELEPSRLYEHPEWAAVGALGTYDPDSSIANTSLQLALGARFIKPYMRDATYDFATFQFQIARTFADGEHIVTPEISFSNYLPRTRLFTFDHHFFYGAGLGTAVVERDGQPTVALAVGTLSAGLNARLAHFDIESSVKLVVSPRRHVYDASGLVPQVAIVYPLGE